MTGYMIMCSHVDLQEMEYFVYFKWLGLPRIQYGLV